MIDRVVARFGTEIDGGAGGVPVVCRGCLMGASCFGGEEKIGGGVVPADGMGGAVVDGIRMGSIHGGCWRRR